MLFDKGYLAKAVKFLESSSSSELIEKAKTFRLSGTRPNYGKVVSRLILNTRSLAASMDKAVVPAKGSVEAARAQLAVRGTPTHQPGGLDDTRR